MAADGIPWNNPGYRLQLGDVFAPTDATDRDAMAESAAHSETGSLPLDERYQLTYRALWLDEHPDAMKARKNRRRLQSQSKAEAERRRAARIEREERLRAHVRAAVLARMARASAGASWTSICDRVGAELKPPRSGRWVRDLVPDTKPAKPKDSRKRP